MRLRHRLRDSSSVAAPPDISQLPARSPGLVPRWSGSVDPSTPTDRVAVGWPTEPGERIPVAVDRVPATTSSCAAQAFIEGHRLQLVHDPGPRLHHAMPVPQQLPQIPVLPSLVPRSAGNDPRACWLALAPPTLLGRRSRHCHGINYTQKPPEAGSGGVVGVNADYNS